MLALGLEFSTQSVKMLALDGVTGDVAYAGSFDYDSAFPAYGTERGVLPSANPEVRHTSPRMMLEALDRAFSLLAENGIAKHVRAVKVDAMQHCTVYAGPGFGRTVAALDPRKTLLEQAGPCLTRETIPIWEDRCTAAEALYLAARLAAHGGIESLTGNRAELRFPAAQVMKWGAGSPEEYNRTAHIFLLSAFVTCVLAGRVAAVDTGDGWGTNLNNLDLAHPGWCGPALAIVEGYLASAGCAAGLGERMGAMAPYDAPVGTAAGYFTEKYGVPAGAVVLAGTGDNPATLLGCGGAVVVSLGSSYTVNGVMDALSPSPSGEYNVFGYTPGRAMALSVITNGGKVHDSFSREYVMKGGGQAPCAADRDAYARLAGGPALSPEEPLLLPYLLDESVPLKKRGIVRAGFAEGEARANVRALHVSQALSIRLHAGHIREPASLCVVGGGSRSLLMRQLLADLFGCEVYSIADAASAAPFGCAVSGLRHLRGLTYDEAAGLAVRHDRSSTCLPLAENAGVTAGLLERYKSLESGI
jgi:xylulokinase